MTENAVFFSCNIYFASLLRAHIKVPDSEWLIGCFETWINVIYCRRRRHIIHVRERKKISSYFFFITKRWRRLILLLFTSSNCMYLINLKLFFLQLYRYDLNWNQMFKKLFAFYWSYIQVYTCWKFIYDCCRHSIGDFSYFIKRWAQSVILFYYCYEFIKRNHFCSWYNLFPLFILFPFPFRFAVLSLAAR